MPLRKRLLVPLAAAAALLLLAGGAWRFFRVSSLLEIGVGYSAQITCACLFVSQRPLPSCLQDLEPLARRLITVEPGPNQVTARSLALGRATARFDEAYGCTILP
jgi:hypothetical protein